MRWPILFVSGVVTVSLIASGTRAGAQPAPRKKAPAKGATAPPAATKAAPAAPAATKAAPAAAAPTAGPTFKGFADLPDTVQIATAFSPDQQAATVIFRNLQAQVSGKGGSNVGTRVQTVVLPLANNGEKTVHVTQDIRGFASTQGKALVALVIQAAGTTTVVDLSTARDNAKSRAAAPRSAAATAAHNQATEKAKALPPKEPYPPGGSDFDFVKRVEADIAAGTDYQITFVLVAERQNADEGTQALLTIDSLDVAFAAAAGSTK